MSYQEVQQLAEKFAQALTPSQERNKEFSVQRIKLEYFHKVFYRKMRSILGTMEGDIRTLREKGFDPKMMKLFITAYRDLIEILKSVDEKRPYAAAEKFIKYVLERPNSSILENLDFLIQHHLKASLLDTKEGLLLGQSKADAIQQLKELAINLKKFIADNPLIPVPGQSVIPPEDMEEPIATKPSPVGSIDKTNPALPFGKNKPL